MSAARALTVPALLAAILFGCVAPAAGPTTATPTATARATATPIPTPALSIAVTEAVYGRLALSTRPAARCDIVIDMAPGRLGDRPPGRTSDTVGAGGTLLWTYPTPPQPAQRASYGITCNSGDERAFVSAPFQLAGREPRAAAFTARVVAADPPSDVSPDQALVPLRDSTIALIRTALPREWSAATRGLGSVKVTDDPAEVLIKVVAARSTSVHVTSGDGSQEIRIFVAGPTGTQVAENLVAIALHEIGHIWCCRGEGAEPGGHWATAVEDPELQGVDRFGLMNHPVTCKRFGTVLSCPNRFSRRDLESFGFTDIPSPPADPCLSQARPLEARMTALDATIAARRAAVEASEVTLSAISVRLRAIEAQHGRTLPPGVYEEYNSLVDRYNAQLPAYRAALAAHNGAVAERNALVTSRNSLPC